MSTSIDESIVSIKFDNAKFEANVRATMTTLDGLKKSLDFSAGVRAMNELDNAGKKINVKFDNTAFNASVKETVDSANKLKQNLKFDGVEKGLNELDAAGKKINLKLDPTAFQAGANGIIDAANKIKQNLNFESVQRGFGSLKTSAQSLSFQSVVTGSQTAIGKLQELDLAGRAVNFASTSEGAAKAQQSISAMSIAGIAALGALAFKAASVGMQMGQSLFIDPAKNGLAEYETNLNSIQTILANTQSKGSTITDVNAALEELNAYSDQTIYNFGEMAKAIGTFTTAGVDLDTSTASIKGLSNVAAMSGANSTQAAGAMEQLSRAMSSGKVALQDWMSIETAGMASEAFRESLMETARTQGIAVDDMVAKNGSFRLSLQEGWLTTDIMTDTLEKFTGDLTDAQLQQMGYNAEQIASIQTMAKTAKDAATKVKTFTQLMGTLQETSGSGWAKSAQLILGDFEQARTMWTNVNNVLGGMLAASADSRNKLLGDWNALGGRDRMISAVTHAFSALMEVLAPVQQAFREVFPPMTGQQLFDLTEAINHFMWLLRPSTEQVNLIKGAFLLFFTVLKIGLDIIKGAVGVVYAFFKAFATGGDSISGSLKPLTDSLAQITERIKNSTLVTDFFAKLTQVATVLGAALGRVIPIIARMVDYAYWTGVLMWKSIGYYLGLFTDFMSGVLISVLSDGIDIFLDLLEAVVHFGEDIPKAIKAFTEGGLEAAIDVFKNSMSALGDTGELVFKRIIERVESIKRFADRVATAWDNVMASLARVWDKMLPLREAVSELFRDLGEQLKSVFSDVNYDDTLDMVNTGLLAGLVLLFRNAFKKMLGMGDGVKEGLLKHLETSVESINDVLGALTDTLGAMQQNLQADTLMKIAIAIGILTISVIALSLIDSADLTKSLVTIGIMVVILTKAMEALDKITVGTGFLKIPFIAASMILLAIALAILVIPVTALSKLSWGELIKGLVGTIALMIGLSRAAEAMSKNPADLIATGIGLIAVAIAIKILASAVKDISELSFGQMIQGLIGVGVLLTALSIFNNMTKVNKGSLANAAGLILLGVALKIMASAMGDFAAMDIGSLIQGLATLGIVLALLQRFSVVVDGKEIVKTAAAILILGVALKIIASAMGDFAALSWEDTAKGLLIMSIALHAMSTALARVPKDMLQSAVGFIAIAVGLKILASALKDFATMSWEEIGKAMAVLAASMVILSVAMIAMQGTLSGAAALLVVSGALLILGQALTIFGNLSWEQMLHGFAALAGVFVIFGLAGLILAPLVPVLFSLGMSILMLGGGLAGIGLGTVLFAAGLIAIGAAVAIAGPMLIAFIGSILALIPIAMVELGKGIVQFAEVIGNAMPVFLNAFVELLKTLLTAIQMVFPQLMDTLWMLIVGLVEIVVRGIPLFVDAGMKIIIGILKGVGDNMGQLIDAAYKVVTEFIDGIARNLPGIIDSGINLIISFVEGLAEGVRNNSDRMSDAGWDLAEAIVSGMVNGIGEGVSRVVTAAQDLAKNVWESAMKALDAHSPSRKFVKLGGWTADGLAIGIDDNSYKAERASERMGYAAVESLKKAMTGVSDIAPDGDITPTIRPVLDLSAVKKDAALIPGMFTPPSLSVGSSYNKAATLSVEARAQRDAMISESEVVSEPTIVEKNITVIQNNHSPKALSRADIYRDLNTKVAELRKGALVRVAD